MLRVKVVANYQELYEVQAVRQTGSEDPDSVGTYRVSLVKYLDPLCRTRSVRNLGTIEHRYGDKALVLSKKLLDLALEEVGE